MQDPAFAFPMITKHVHRPCVASACRHVARQAVIEEICAAAVCLGENLPRSISKAG